MKWLGWAAGLALAVVVAVTVPVGFIGGVLLGFGLSMTGLLLGAAAER